MKPECNLETLSSNYLKILCSKDYNILHKVIIIYLLEKMANNKTPNPKETLEDLFSAYTDISIFQKDVEAAFDFIMDKNTEWKTLKTKNKNTEENTNNTKQQNSINTEENTETQDKDTIKNTEENTDKKPQIEKTLSVNNKKQNNKKQNNKKQEILINTLKGYVPRAHEENTDNFSIGSLLRSTDKETKGKALILHLKRAIKRNRGLSAVKLKDNLKMSLYEKGVKIPRTWDFVNYQSALRLVSSYGSSDVEKGYIYFTTNKFWRDKIDSFTMMERHWTKYQIQKNVNRNSNIISQEEIIR